MIKLLIVEDEQTIHNGWAHRISWESLGVDRVQSTEKAEDALSACDLFCPDIVLVDLCTSKMNDIEMYRKIRERLPLCQIIFLANYADKGLQKAITALGAVYFIEKPFSSDLLLEDVQKAVQICCKNSMINNPECSCGTTEQIVLRALAYGDYPKDFEKSMLASGIFCKPFSAFRFCILRSEHAIVHISRMQTELQKRIGRLPAIEKDGCVASAFLDDRNFCILLCGEAASIDENCAFLNALRSRVETLTLQNNRFFMAVGGCVESPMQLYRSFGYSQACMRELFFQGWGRWAAREAYRPMLPVQYDKSLNAEFSNVFSNRDAQAVDHILQKIYQKLAQQADANPEEIRKIYYTLDYLMSLECERRIYTESVSGGNIPAVSELETILNIETLQEMHAFTVKRAHRLMEIWTTDDESCSAVLQVTRFMRTNYSDKNLSVKSLAESVYLTPTYLSGLFKKRTGKTIGRYLTEIRIEHAMKLLMDKQLKLYHIAEMVGYDDANYFSKIFKRHVGMTPSEFRERKLL